MQLVKSLSINFELCVVLAYKRSAYMPN